MTGNGGPLAIRVRIGWESGGSNLVNALIEAGQDSVVWTMEAGASLHRTLDGNFYTHLPSHKRDVDAIRLHNH